MVTFARVSTTHNCVRLVQKQSQNMQNIHMPSNNGRVFVKSKKKSTLYASFSVTFYSI
jgi:hypothetical protein